MSEQLTPEDRAAIEARHRKGLYSEFAGAWMCRCGLPVLSCDAYQMLAENARLREAAKLADEKASVFHDAIYAAQGLEDAERQAMSDMVWAIHAPLRAAPAAPPGSVSAEE